MAKPKVVKIADEWKLRDLFNAGKLEDGQKVNFVIPKYSNGKRKKWEFCRGTLSIYYRTFCECCGPEFGAAVLDADGKIKQSWGRYCR
jgi:hypothetical protein